MSASTGLRVDAHHHVWDLSVRRQTWMDPRVHGPIQQTFTIDQLAGSLRAAGVSATVVVQTVPDPAETPELLALADREPLVAAVVGWVDLTGADVGRRINQLAGGAGGAHLAGIRHQVHDEVDARWLCRDDVRRGLAAVRDAGLAYDLLVRPQHLAAALETVRALPDLSFVVDHAAKPPVAAGQGLQPDDIWFAGMRALAGEANVSCKLSGLLVEADWQRWRAPDITPYAEAVLELFGSRRVMVGSDWPVCLLAGTYEESLTVYDAAIGRLSAPEQADVRGLTAQRIYAIAASSTS